MFEQVNAGSLMTYVFNRVNKSVLTQGDVYWIFPAQGNNFKIKVEEICRDCSLGFFLFSIIQICVIIITWDRHFESPKNLPDVISILLRYLSRNNQYRCSKAVRFLFELDHKEPEQHRQRSSDLFVNLKHICTWLYRSSPLARIKLMQLEKI